jgi:Family of unknown function (DUF6527)
MKLKPFLREGAIAGYYFDCPGCKAGHHVAVRPNTLTNGASWEFNGDLINPTFSPSVLSRYEFTPESGKQTIICHSFVKNGQIEFLSDCTHELAGQTIPMLEIADEDDDA